ncbi:Hypothetical predicted protein [Mytilus galloprovincialis]|uniref:RRM domain-containing protein n=1 Tax=Mytilus galloprovincialis TaxID=29158 RepID=A0A8B6CSL2_MYTGA|nr:Hypothetical predicted protein [Mytilus galloprovincialis]
MADVNNTTVSSFQVHPNMSTNEGSKCSTSRKRQVSGSDDSDAKKIRSTHSTEVNDIASKNIPNMSESELFLFSAIQNLANNISRRFPPNYKQALKTQIDEEVSKVKNEFKQDIETLNVKIEEVQKSCEDIKRVKPKQPDIRNNIVIRNLPYDEREKDNKEITKNVVQALFKDGLALTNVDIKSVARKQGNERSPGVVIVELNDFNKKKEIFKKNKDLKESRKYDKVYIDNDMPLETRIHQNNMRTLLKELGKERSFTFSGNRLTKRIQ